MGPRIRLLDKTAIRAPSPYLCGSTRTRSHVLRSNSFGSIVATSIDLDPALCFLYVTLTSHSFYVHFYSRTIGFRPAPLSTIALNCPKTLQVAQRLHAAMWKPPLKPRLKDISDRSGKVLKYVPATHIWDLELRRLGFPEDVLLIRHENISALEELTSRSSDQARGDGVYDTGHPGISMALSLYATVFSPPS